MNGTRHTGGKGPLCRCESDECEGKGLTVTRTWPKNLPLQLLWLLDCCNSLILYDATQGIRNTILSVLSYCLQYIRYFCSLTLVCWFHL